MRFKSKTASGYTVYAVCGVHSASFAIDFTAATTDGLLGFAIERYDPQDGERYYMPNTKVFEDLVPDPAPEQHHSSFDHPIQSFVWDDFSVKPGYQYQYFFYPVTGKPKNLVRSDKPVSIWVCTEPEHDSRSQHDVFFNRGVASSQAYARKFKNRRPDKIEDPKERAAAEEWLSRGLDEALVKFIDQAKKGDALRACLYEFHYLPVIEEFAKAIKRGVDVKIIYDAKDNPKKDESGKLVSFPRDSNAEATRGRIPKKNLILREANKNNIQHNKFIIYLKGKTQVPTAVWTGSTNISEGGIYGQTNVGHWVRDKKTTASFLAYWELLSTDPGNRKDRTDGRKNNAAYKKAIASIQPDLTVKSLADVPDGITCIFSPRPKDVMLSTYCTLLDKSEQTGCVTLAFGVGSAFKDILRDNTPHNTLIFMLLEKQDKPKKNAKKPFVRLTAKNNIYQAWGARIDLPLYQWTREITTGELGLNRHVRYIHTKFMLADPLAERPVVITGSANFSRPSTVANDENMLIITGNRRVADIYFTEFMRLFSHYYFRSMFELFNRKKSGKKAGIQKDSIFIAEDDSWLEKYKKGLYRRKRVEMFVNMGCVQQLTADPVLGVPLSSTR